jgi:EpsD family peptidyl-prolyl cis-trans isomerase
MNFSTLKLRHAAIVLASTGGLLLAGCGDDKKPATQVAAKVHQEEISVHQINDVLGRSGKVPPEQIKQASRQILERLVDQELLVQKAVEKKLDRDPKAMLAIEAARREILARMYVEGVTGAVSKPTASEIAEFYAKRPELFSERRVYSFQELAIAQGPDLLPKLQEQMGKAKNLAETAAWLTAEKIPYRGNATTKGAEELPLEMLPRFHQMKDGQIAVIPARDGILVAQLVASRTAPVDQKGATPYIEQYLLNQRKMEASNKSMKELREQAKIEYVGDFAKAESGAGARVANAPGNDTAPAKAATAQAAPAGKSPAAATVGAAAAPVANTSALEKGIAGLK